MALYLRIYEQKLIYSFPSCMNRFPEMEPSLASASYLLNLVSEPVIRHNSEPTRISALVGLKRVERLRPMNAANAEV